MTTPTPTGPAALQGLRVLMGALIAAPVFLAIAMGFVLGGTDGALSPTPLAVAPLVLGVVVHLLVETIGYRLTPIAAGTDLETAARTSTERYQAATILRFALCDSVVVLSIAAAFVVTEGGYLLMLVGAVVSIALMALHCWPWQRPMSRGRAALEADGAQSHLLEAYGLPPEPGGAIRRL